MTIVGWVVAAAGLLGMAGGATEVDNGARAGADQLEVGSHRSTQALPDRAVTAKLQERFATDDMLGREDISVTTDKGVVTLEGSVQSEEARLHATELARQTSGVKRVENNLRVLEGVPPIGTVPK